MVPAFMAAPYFFMIQVTIDSATQVSIGTRSQNQVAVVRACSMSSPSLLFLACIAPLRPDPRSCCWNGGGEDAPGLHRV